MANDGSHETLVPLLVAFSLIMAYLHVIWLIMGAREAVVNRPVRSIWQVLLIGLALATGAGNSLLFHYFPDGVVTEWLIQYSPSHVVTGLAFVVTAAMLWSALRGFNQISSYLVPLTFSLYGAHMLMLSIGNWMPTPGLHLAQTLHMGAAGLLLQSLIGYSIITWLLEIERRDASLANNKAISAEKRLVHYRMHDAMTGLPNRRQLQDQLSVAVRATTSKRSRIAILSIGIHRFKLLSQALGWEQTDKLIHQLIQRLQAIAPPNAVLGRTGERDFLFILPAAGRREVAIDKTRQMLAECAKPFTQNAQDVFLSVSGGLCFSPDDEIDAVALIKIAQQAQLRAVS
ncbi:MAG: diguanylate cyclase domain-containing protein, partial [Wenzhouxiangella sp.]